MFWDELNTIESKVWWSLSELTSDSSIFLCMKALGLGLSKKIIRDRALFLKDSFGFKFITRQQYLTIKGRVNFFLIQETVNLRRVPKFSGYTKHHNDKGNLGPEREFNLSEILEPEVNVSEEIYWEYLTVGKISLFGGECTFPDETPKRVETVPYFKKNRI